MKRVLKFHATWCSPCKELTALLETKPYQNLFIKHNTVIEDINADLELELMETFEVKKLPCMVFINDKDDEVGRLTGKIATTKLDLIEQNLAKL